MSKHDVISTPGGCRAEKQREWPVRQRPSTGDVVPWYFRYGQDGDGQASQSVTL